MTSNIGDGYLEAEQDWAGAMIPIVPVIGNEIVVDGQLIRHGIIRFAKDAQRLYNYYRSAAAEVIGLQPKAPWLAPMKTIEGHEDIWNRSNIDNIPVLPYNIDPDNPQARPTRESPPQASTAMYQEVQVAEADMYSTTGIYPTSLGGKSNETSGKAINARQRESDTGTYVYTDNFKSGAMTRSGEILLDLIPKVMDSERMVRVLGSDGQEKMAGINMVRNHPFYGNVIINDLSASKFDVRVKVGTAYASAREQMREMLSQLVSANPELMTVIGDLYFENMDFPGANKLAARFKKTMPEELVGEGGRPAPQGNPMEDQAAMLALKKAEAEVHDKTESAKGKHIDNAVKAFEFGRAVDAPPIEEQNAKKASEPTLQ
jgi:hypothetical protein